MKGRHLKRRFSLQPSSFMRDIPETNHHRNLRPESHGETKEDDAGHASASPGGSKHKIVVLGGAKVGKSSIIAQFLYGTFSTKYKRTVEEMHREEFNVGGVRLTLEILDTAGSLEFPAMRALSITSGDAFILVYSANDTKSFEEARIIRDQILEIKGDADVPIVVVCNKIDLLENQYNEDSIKTHESIVTVDWENGFVETSAKDNINVSQVFKELLAQAKVKYNLSPALRRRRRQSLPPQQGQATTPVHPAIPSPAQLAHLNSIRERHAGSKRNSCSIS
ncbi:ras-related protein Rap-2a [Cimex lectularius]|uniref:GTP-binding protein Rhes n=1 Tax=Cimex lectularius TaxID=79782 RepID=A0A8I6SDD6_CIMLE|nr:ras-related protein Rap-2a [Cimex lectularius]XP_024081557.1 ras-related protein Rap-2a [Cimex lectularius]